MKYISFALTFLSLTFAIMVANINQTNALAFRGPPVPDQHEGAVGQDEHAGGGAGVGGVTNQGGNTGENTSVGAGGGEVANGGSTAGGGDSASGYGDVTEEAVVGTSGRGDEDEMLVGPSGDDDGGHIFGIDADEDLVVAGHDKTSACPLSNLIGGSFGVKGEMGFRDERRYESGLVTLCEETDGNIAKKSMIDYVVTRVKTEKGRLPGDYREKKGDEYEMQFLLDNVIAESAKRRIDEARGNAAINANFVVNDWSRLIERLAGAIARFSSTGYLSWQTLTAGRAAVFNRDKFDGPIEPGRGVVYIPRVTADTSTSDAWYAAVGAALGCGCTVVTDATENDVNNRVVLRPPMDGFLALGAAEAMSRLGNMMAASGAGGLFGYAMARGVMGEITVRGHVQESICVAKSWRRDRFVLPSGLISVSGERLSTLPMPMRMGREDAIRFVDKILLYTAAACTLSDPMTKVGDNWYPTVLGHGHTDKGLATETLSPEQVDEVAKENGRALCRIATQWADGVAISMSKMLATETAERHKDAVRSMVSRALKSMALDGKNGLGHKVVAPFYWIEPQNIVGSELDGLKMSVEGCGVFCHRRARNVAKQGFECEPKVPTDCGDLFCELDWKMTTLRRNPIFQHMLGNGGRNAELMRPRRMHEDGLVLPGQTKLKHGSFTHRALRGDSIKDWMWSKRTCGLIAPAEFMCLVPGMGASFHFSKELGDCNFQRVWNMNSEKLKNAKVFFTAGNVVASSFGPIVKEMSKKMCRTFGPCLAATDQNEGLPWGSGVDHGTPVSAAGSVPGANLVEVESRGHTRTARAKPRVSRAVTEVTGKQQKVVLSSKLRFGRGRKVTTAAKATKAVASTDGGVPEGEPAAITEAAAVGAGSEREPERPRRDVISLATSMLDKLDLLDKPSTQVDGGTEEQAKSAEESFLAYNEGPGYGRLLYDWLMSRSFEKSEDCAMAYIQFELGYVGDSLGEAREALHDLMGLTGVLSASTIQLVMVSLVSGLGEECTKEEYNETFAGVVRMAIDCEDATTSIRALYADYVAYMSIGRVPRDEEDRLEEVSDDEDLD
ncbi:coat protein [viral metagenome]